MQIFLVVPDYQAPLKQRKVRGNQAPFMAKVLKQSYNDEVKN